MEENDRKNFLSELIEKVKQSLETEKELDKELADTRTREA